MSFRRFALFGGLFAVVVLVALAATLRDSRAQDPGVTTVVPGTAAIWTDRSQYRVGDAIQFCYRIPVPGFITIIDLPADGSQLTIFSGPSAGTGTCLPGTIKPPTGSECLRLLYPLGGTTGQTQTCFQVVGPQPPPPPSGLAIYTDRQVYYIGSAIRVCYRVPAPGPITIIDILPDGTQKIVLSGYDDGTGGCISGRIDPPAGTECMRINFGTTQSAQTCFRVVGSVGSAGSGASSGWQSVGAAAVDDNGLSYRGGQSANGGDGEALDGGGTWNFEGQMVVPTAHTYLRVTSGACDDDPATVLVWEADLQSEGTQVNIEVWTGELHPVGLAAHTGGGGFAFLIRAVAPNATTQVDASLVNLGAAHAGVHLTACLRAP